MKTTIDAAGRLVIPKKLRDEAGIEPGMELEVSCRDGHIQIEPAEIPIHLEYVDGFLVAVADGPMPVLTAEMVARTLQELRDERGTIHSQDDSP
jgi:AbrB family looped-hinge helix DNA binding protein